MGGGTKSNAVTGSADFKKLSRAEYFGAGLGKPLSITEFHLNLFLQKYSAFVICLPVKLLRPKKIMNHLQLLSALIFSNYRSRKNPPSNIPYTFKYIFFEEGFQSLFLAIKHIKNCISVFILIK
jgi:hypothetical protein